MDAMRFALCILTLAVEFPLSVTSWGRSAAHNKEVGGVDDSLHRSFRAVDAVLDPGVNQDAFVKRAFQLGLRVIVESDHLHIQPVT